VWPRARADSLGWLEAEKGDRTLSVEPRIEPNVRQAVPFFRVSNILASVRFYADGLGFEMKNRWVVEGELRWCWLELGGAALMLQEFPKEGPNAWVPQGKLGEGVSIAFQCEDSVAIYHEAMSRGLQASKPFVGNGLWVTLLSDPDGYKIEFASPTNVPEGTELS
jgi:lactoylglutathione lyase